MKQKKVSEPRPLPKGCQELADVMTEAGRSCPLGRALYACNRRLNGGHGGHGKSLEVAGGAREDTAQRWLDHWRRGGSIYNLSETHEQHLARQRDKSDRLLSEGDRLRRMVRRARRGLIEVAYDETGEPISEVS